MLETCPYTTGIVNGVCYPASMEGHFVVEGD